VASDRNLGGPDSLYTAERIAVIRVEDNGPGIASENLGQIFDPFFSTKEPGEGTGLGLAICARLVEGMGGRITAGNLDGGGAVFTIRLPGTVSSPDPDRGVKRRTIHAGREAGRISGGAS
jgi:signal transduction histidine kinase